MSFRHLAAACAVGLVAAACGSTSTSVPTSTATPSGPNDKRVELRDTDGNVVGTATLSSVDVTEASPSSSGSPGGRSPSASAESSSSASSSPGSSAATTGVRFHIQIKSLPPGSHGFHVHNSGRCEPPSFTSAGPHFNPTNKRHGLANRAGPHAGDLPNLPVGADGRATVDIVSNLMSLEGDRDNSLTGASGSALVVHAKTDDEVSDPAGNSGDRIACGVISPSKVTASGSPDTGSNSPSATPTGGSNSRSTPTPTPTPTPSPSPSASGRGTGQEGNPNIPPLCSPKPVPPTPCTPN